MEAFNFEADWEKKWVSILEGRIVETPSVVFVEVRARPTLKMEWFSAVGFLPLNSRSAIMGFLPWPDQAWEMMINPWWSTENSQSVTEFLILWTTTE